MERDLIRAVLHLVAKEGGEADGETQRGQEREGDEEMEAPCQSRDALMQRREKRPRHREEGKGRSQAKTSSDHLLGRQEASSVRAQGQGARHRAFRATAPGNPAVSEGWAGIPCLVSLTMKPAAFHHACPSR